MTLTSAGLADLVRYVLVCVIAVSTGVGLIRVARVRLGVRTSILIAPVITHAFWAIQLGVGVLSGIRVRDLALPIWLVTLPFALYGLWTLVGFWILVASMRPANHAGAGTSATGERSTLVFLLLGVCALLPLILLLPDSLSGLSTYGGYGSDGWSYVADGQYLWQFPRGTDGGLSPLHQWAAHLSGSRYIGASELGLLSVLWTPGDTQAAEGLLVALTLFSVAGGCVAFASQFGLSTRRLLLYVSVTLLSGWTLNLLQIDNYDYAAALMYFPGLAAAVRDAQSYTLRRWAFIGFLSAGLYYTYPELALLILACTGLFVVERLGTAGALRGVLMAGAFWLVLTSPFLKESMWIFQVQGQSMAARPRPGEGYFPALLIPKQQIFALWSLDGDFGVQHLRALQLLLGLALFLLLLVGLVRLLRLGAWSLVVTVVGLGCAAAVLIEYYHYAYGAYKFLVLGWWLVMLAVLLGATWPMAVDEPSANRLVWCGTAVLVVLSLPGVFAIRLVQTAPQLEAQEMRWFRPVERVQSLVGDAPIGILLHRPLASYWAVYFLRDHPIRLLEFPGYLGMPHVQPFLARGRPVPLESIRFLLTDSVDRGPLLEDEGWRRVWRQGPYSLWDTRAQGWAVVRSAETPNGFETINGQPFFWMGAGATSFDLIASRPGSVRLTARFKVGPNLPRDTTSLRVAVANSRGLDHVESIAPGPGAICLPVTSVATTWHLTPLNAAVPPPPAASDHRTLLIGLLLPTIEWSSSSAGAGGC